MNTSKNINAAAVLDSLSPQSVAALESHFRNEILSTLTATLGSPIAAVATATAVADTSDDSSPVKRGPGRPRKNPEKVEEPAKRGPGRPAGSKNKAKADIGPSGRAKAAKAAAKAAAAGPTPRIRLADGRTASQVIRDFDEKYNTKHEEEAQASLVVAHCAKLGLEIKPSLVYNCRQNVKKAAAKASKKAKKTAK
ncbi:hypothetical protein M0R72_00910 [Candidatus Pacearchaeota archaeon]|jgi:hypothetical protein|nr:hypothetical protein [Candidatus Pacearchaeota archaeon]